MTDSMKFGPEWLRNLSTDSVTNISIGSAGSGNSSGGGGVAATGSGNSFSNQNSLTSFTSNCGGGAANSYHANTSSASLNAAASSLSLQQRNALPQFRYGREELLSLFEKNCNLPDILPGHKKLFVEKVQVPLALTPSTDEESSFVQISAPPTQRPTWLRRSPVGFSPAPARGTGRGGSSLDRGRMRGKASYHGMYQQRPNALLFDTEDGRTVTAKPERSSSWIERNGGNGADGTTTTNYIGSGGGGVAADCWNGTSAPSPRKEFSTHQSRHMENWRKNRQEELSSDVTATGGCIVATDGWRGGGSSSSYGNIHSRWGRSASWRDEDTSVASTGTDAYSGGGSGHIMQRSVPTISSTNLGRSSYDGTIGITKTSSLGTSYSSCSGSVSVGGSSSSGTQSNSEISASSSATSVSGRHHWTSTAMSNEPADELPEWAMENPSDSGSGGTFDASGAFHGSIDEALMDGDKDYYHHHHRTHTKHKKASSASSSDDSLQSTTAPVNNNDDSITDQQQQQNNGEVIKEEVLSIEKALTITTATKASVKENKNKNIANDDAISSADSVPINLATKSPEIMEQLQQQQNQVEVGTKRETFAERSAIPITSKENNNTVSNSQSANSVLLSNDDSVTAVAAVNTLPIESSGKQKDLQTANSPQADLSDHMQEVADNMVEKLIMDDDNLGTSIINNVAISNTTKHTTNNGTNPNCVVGGAVPTHQTSFVNVTAIMKPTTSVSVTQVAAAASETLPTLPANQKVLPLYGGGGSLILEHATVQQQQQQHLHQQQQEQQLAAATATTSPHSTISSAASADLWYYRDPQLKVQGPFNALEMTDWYRAGYFDENLFVRRVCDTRFRALGELIKLCHGNMPFTHTHLIPMGLDAVVVGDVATTAAPAATNPIAALRQLRDGKTQQQQQQQQITDYSLSLQQQEQRELKSNVTAAADTLTAAVKNLINPIDMTHILNVHFQMLQEQYLRHQEMLIVAEYSSKECFQCLTPTEREAVVRQKVQMLGLPEYLRSLNGLSNTLAALNPTAGNLLYDAIETACAKKEQQHPTQQVITNLYLDSDDFMLNVQKQQQQQNQQQQQQQQQQQLSSNFVNVVGYGENNAATNITSATNMINDNDRSAAELINDFNLQLFLRRSNNINSTQQQQQQQPSQQQQHQLQQQQHSKTTLSEYTVSHDNSANNLLAQQQQLIATTATQGPAVQMWMPQLNVAGDNNVLQQQQPPPFVARQTTATNVAHTNQWNANHPSSTIGSLQSSAALSGFAAGGMVVGALVPQKKSPSPTSMWGDTLPLDNLQNPFAPSSSVLRYNLQGQRCQGISQGVLQTKRGGITAPIASPIVTANNNEQHQQQSKHDSSPNEAAATAVVIFEKPSMANNAKELQHTSSAISPAANNEEQSDSNKASQNNATKRNNNHSNSGSSKTQTTTAAHASKKDGNNSGIQATEEHLLINKKHNEEERRRETAEEKKRRQKEERRRQQTEDEKRRLQLLENEKQRQQLEENERQQQIQAQRRKAMLGTAETTAGSGATVPSYSTSNAFSLKSTSNTKQTSSSVAPWSIQVGNNLYSSGGNGVDGPPPPPSLAEIQKAERRERRADQQRQVELMLEKQMMRSAATDVGALEAGGGGAAHRTWNASSLPVQNFAEIQAEEARRLATEHLENQRRKEQEHTAALADIVAGGGNCTSGVLNTNNISAIWGGSAGGGGANKAWGNTTNAGFWEEPIKFSTAIGVGATNNNNNSFGQLAPGAVGFKSQQQQPNAQQKGQQTTAMASSQNSNTAATLPTVVNRNNLSKSQTVSTMQTTVLSKGHKQQQQQQQQKLIVGQNVASAEKKSTAASGKSQHHGVAAFVASPNNNTSSHPTPGGNSNNKKDDYQNEFTGWCMRSLGGMNTKVDVPTFVTFLQDLESPYEVKDYVRMYLGEGREYMEFAKQFLERRSKYKNLQRAQNAHNDDMCKPAPAITPSSGNNNDSSDNKGKQKKIKKNKMTKLDARILGFSVTAAEGRINVGDRDYVDAP